MTGPLPAGVVTFLLTDIEASTRILRADPDRFAELVDLHDRLLRAVWHRHAGHEIGTEGDSFLVAFADAGDALAAAADAQRAVAAATWPTALPVRVRAGVHTGYARPHGAGYRALVVHQTTRVAAAAHGGQVLVTDDTARRAGALPAGVTLRRLGRFRVRDFDEPVLLHRLAGPGLPDVGTAPRVRPADGHNLVAPTSSLVDREDDLAALPAMLSAGSVVTVLGPGGVGKTRLAVEVALRVVPQWPDGVWIVDLAPVTTPTAVTTAVASATGAPSSPGEDPLEQLAEHLRDLRTLLVLDNCEHVAGPVRDVVVRLFDRTRSLAVLATSRTPLGLRAERAYRLQPLTGDAEAAGVRLFAERAAATADLDPGVVAELVAELDGLPLAIELAAARTASLSPAEILVRVRSTPSALASSDPGLPERQRSLQRLLDWSFSLLDATARDVLLRLGAFAGGFDLETAEELCVGTGVPAADVADALWTLLDHSLLRRQTAAGATRFRLPVTVRSFVRDRMPAPDATVAVDRLAAVYVGRLGPARTDDGSWPGEMALELDNVRHVIGNASDAAAETAQRLAWAVGRYHDVTDAFLAGIQEVSAWSASLDARTPSRVALLTLLADLLLRVGDVAGAEGVLREAEHLADDVGLPEWDDAGLARTAGEIVLRHGDVAEAGRRARQALRRVHSPRGRARLWNLVGLSAVLGGHQREAVRAFEAELAAETEGGLLTFAATTHGNLAETYLQLGETVPAAVHQRTSLQLARAYHQRGLVAFALMVAGRLELGTGGDAATTVALQAVADRLLDQAGFRLYPEDAEARDGVLLQARQ
ncbi:MAG: AAA family ATPase, partial [Actinomycetota bacterium]